MPSFSKPAGVLIVGSVPAASAHEAFTRVATAVASRLHTLPDGETGERWNYIGWQLQRFPRETRRMELGGTPLPATGPPTYTLADVQSTGYDEAALASYAEFTRLRQQGTIPPNVRFQICLPTPYNVLVGHLKPEVEATIEPIYEQRFAEALDQIGAGLPHDDMVIQWDLCFEMTALEFERGRLTETRHRAYFPSPVLPGLVDRVERLCERIPKDIKLAFHLCYGDLQHKHFIEPQDTSLLVEVANALLARDNLGQRTEWIHLPVPKNRVDTEYFTPLTNLNLNSREGVPPRLYLGVVHANDEAGTRQRISVAQSVVPFPFGVATECGFGRTPPDEIESILQICKAVTAEV